MNNKTDKITQKVATYIAMAVRNEMEDFHCKHLSDEQMKELNPIIRNAIFSALYASDHYEEDAWCKKYVDFQNSLIPGYWEKPELSDYAIRMMKSFENMDGDDSDKPTTDKKDEIL